MFTLHVGVLTLFFFFWSFQNQNKGLVKKPMKIQSIIATATLKQTIFEKWGTLGRKMTPSACKKFKSAARRNKKCCVETHNDFQFPTNFSKNALLWNKRRFEFWPIFRSIMVNSAYELVLFEMTPSSSSFTWRTFSTKTYPRYASNGIRCDLEIISSLGCALKFGSCRKFNLVSLILSIQKQRLHEPTQPCKKLLTTKDFNCE